MRTARALSALMRSMPAFDTGPRERLAWLELKAQIFGEIAAEHAVIVADATSYAAAAREQAESLRADLDELSADEPTSPEPA